MIKLVSGQDFKEVAVRILTDDSGHVVEAIANLRDCSCKDGHVTLRVVDKTAELEKAERLRKRIESEWTLVRRD